VVGAAGQPEDAGVVLDTGPHQVGEQALDERPAFLVGEQLEELLGLTSASTALSGLARAAGTPSIQPSTNFWTTACPSGFASRRESQTITSKIRLVAVFVE
jgi:hypothetical protein